MRHDLFIGAAILCLALAVVIPQAQKRGIMGALLALLILAGGLAAALGLLLAATWLMEQAGRPASGWRGTVATWAGHLLRFALFGVIGSALGAGLCLWHGLAPATEDGLALAALILGGGAGCFARHRLGPARFWPAFRRFSLALLGSFLGGILGILVPGNWGVTIGILVPLLVFAILAAFGRMVPPPGEAPPPPA